MSKANPHYTILKSLYDLSRIIEDKESLAKIAAIAWTLEHDLNFDSYGYFELSELINFVDQPDTQKHYTEVIESSLKKLASQE